MKSPRVDKPMQRGQRFQPYYEKTGALTRMPNQNQYSKHSGAYRNVSLHNQKNIAYFVKNMEIMIQGFVK